MSSKPVAAIVCAAGLVAGCGSGSHPSPTTPSPSSSTAKTTGPPMARVGPAGQLAPASGAGYQVTKGSVFNIRVALVRFFTSKGFSGVTAHCKPVNTGVASCDVAGMDRSDQSRSSTITISVGQTRGALRITSVGS